MAGGKRDMRYADAEHVDLAEVGIHTQEIMYYRRSYQKPGRRLSETTLMTSGQVIGNRAIVTET